MSFFTAAATSDFVGFCLYQYHCCCRWVHADNVRSSDFAGLHPYHQHCCCSEGYLQLRELQTSVDFAFSSTTAAAGGFTIMSSDHQTTLGLHLIKTAAAVKVPHDITGLFDFMGRLYIRFCCQHYHLCCCRVPNGALVQPGSIYPGHCRKGLSMK